MNENSSRFLDYFIGVPLCWMLTRLRRCIAWLAPHPASGPVEPPRGILFVKLAEMGAIVLTMPAFEEAIRRVGRQNLYIVMLASNRQVHELLKVFPDENVLTISDRNLWVFARDTWRFLRRCRALGIEAVIDLEGFARISAIISFLTGCRIRVGLHRFTTEGPYRGDLFTHRVACNYYNHASVQFQTMVAALDADPVELPLLKQRVELQDYRLPLLQPADDELAEVDRMVEQACGGTPSRPLVILNCNLVDLLPLRQWPRRHFLELGRRILEAHPTATLLLTGLEIERKLSTDLAREISPTRAHSVAGDTKSLRSLVVLFTRADLLITSDCGPGHMAALTDIPILSIFGPETPQLYSPLSPHNQSLWAGLACSPCLSAFNHRRSVCKNNVCMQTITVDQVFQAAVRLCPALAGGSDKAAIA